VSPTAVLAGVGGYVPPRVVTNDEIARRLGTTDAWIRTRTGIGQRHWADPGTTTGDLATEAGERALKSAGVRDVDLVVLATSTGNQPMPATAPEVAANLGLGRVAAYDVSAACAGFVYALTAAGGAIALGLAEKVLVIGADLWSTRLDPQDRSTSIIFGDGAGAAVLRAGVRGDRGALLAFDAGSDGARRSLAVVPAGGSRQRSQPDVAELANEFLTMRGRDLFTQAVDTMADSSRRLLGKVGWAAADVDWCVAHQANARILHTVADVLSMPRERMLSNVGRVGNTSAASIPLLLSEAAGDGRVQVGQRLVLTSFGGGLSWASTALVWPAI
jgi:3-oxoacyl-[acyl-carrier-protein] synthase-3